MVTNTPVPINYAQSQVVISGQKNNYAQKSKLKNLHKVEESFARFFSYDIYIVRISTL